MAETRIVSIIGRKNAGKTTLAVALAAEFVRRGRRVMALKHGTHADQPDRPGTDSWRHYHEGKAERVLLAGPDGRALFERAPDLYDPEALVRQYLHDADIVIVEGYKKAPLPKIEVWRRAIPGGPLYDPDAASRGEWIALVTDDEKYQAECRVLRFNDTMWLQLLANLAWEHAKVLTT